MYGFILLIPLLFTRYVLLCLLDSASLKRAAFFPPLVKGERIAYWVYQISTLLLFILLCFARIAPSPPWFYAGLAIYGIGVLLLVVSTVSFARPTAAGINLRGLYRVSRNPMYVAYFAYLLGCVLLTQSLPLLVLLCAFQISAHWIILSEERWCREIFGEPYLQYMKRVRRYF